MFYQSTNIVSRCCQLLFQIPIIDWLTSSWGGVNSSVRDYQNMEDFVCQILTFSIGQPKSQQFGCRERPWYIHLHRRIEQNHCADISLTTIPFISSYDSLCTVTDNPVIRHTCKIERKLERQGVISLSTYIQTPFI